VRSFVGVNCHLSKMDACSRYGQASPRFFITRGIYIYIYIYIYQKWILSHCSLNLHGLKLVDIDSYFFFLSFFFLVSNHGSAPCVCVRE
jgi:hypothetical protein